MVSSVNQSQLLRWPEIVHRASTYARSNSNSILFSDSAGWFAANYVVAGKCCRPQSDVFRAACDHGVDSQSRLKSHSHARFNDAEVIIGMSRLFSIQHCPYSRHRLWTGQGGTINLNCEPVSYVFKQG